MSCIYNATTNAKSAIIAATGNAQIALHTGIAADACNQLTKRVLKCLNDGLELAGVQVERVRQPGKVDAATFARITGWTGRTNEHQRDAGMLAITTRRWK